MLASVDCLSRDEPRRGQDLEQQARHILEKHPHFRGRTSLFQYECDLDVLTVRGFVSTFYLKQLLQSALQSLAVRIDNQVVVAGYVNGSEVGLIPAGV
jgi:hypothetical protein